MRWIASLAQQWLISVIMTGHPGLTRPETVGNDEPGRWDLALEPLRFSSVIQLLATIRSHRLSTDDLHSQTTVC
jgi:hypothetical protein